MWNLKNKINKQTHRYRKQTDGCCQMDRSWGLGEKGERIKQCKLVVMKWSQGYKVQHREKGT